MKFMRITGMTIRSEIITSNLIATPIMKKIKTYRKKWRNHVEKMDETCQNKFRNRHWKAGGAEVDQERNLQTPLTPQPILLWSGQATRSTADMDRIKTTT